MDKIEQVAESLWQEDSIRARGHKRLVDWSECEAPDKWRGLAKAAIEAMREPTEQMVKTGDDAANDGLDGYSDGCGDAGWYIKRGTSESVFNAMIDAALEGK